MSLFQENNYLFKKLKKYIEKKYYFQNKLIKHKLNTKEEFLCSNFLYNFICNLIIRHIIYLSLWTMLSINISYCIIML